MGKKNPLIDHEGNMVWIFPMVWWYNFDKRGLALIGVGIWAFFLPFWRFFGHFQALPGIWESYNIWNANRKLGLAVRLRVYQVSRTNGSRNIELWNFWAFLGHFDVFGHFRHFPMGSNKFLQISPNSQSFSTLKFKYVSLRHIVLTCDI